VDFDQFDCLKAGKPLQSMMLKYVGKHFRYEEIVAMRTKYEIAKFLSVQFQRCTVRRQPL
jgi:hypothetical protein